jgi:hypothetical protein
MRGSAVLGQNKNASRSAGRPSAVRVASRLEFSHQTDDKPPVRYSQIQYFGSDRPPRLPRSKTVARNAGSHEAP